MAYQSPSAPICSGTFGFPITHYYIIGAILAYVSYLLITFTKTVRDRIKREVIKMHAPRAEHNYS